MTNEQSRNPVEELAEEFMRRRRDGELVTVNEYARDYPALAEKIRGLFPTLELLENARSGSERGNLIDESKAGQRLGDYQLLREIGRGGMGVVYEALQRSLDRRVALKVLSPGLQKNQKYLERFQREARAAASLHHANIVPVFGTSCEEGHHYYVMQYIHGRGLDDVFTALVVERSETNVGDPASQPAGELANALATGEFRSRDLDSDKHFTIGNVADNNDNSFELFRLGTNQTLPSANGSLSGRSRSSYFRRIAELGCRAADALSYAHRNGVIHRDIKPGNLLLDVYGNIWITDFGLAKFSGDEGLTETGDILGTLRYIAPESLQGKFDQRSDIYSLGLTLHEMLSREKAFSAISRGELIRQISVQGPTALDQVPRDLKTIVQKATALDPADRYQDAAQFFEDLTRFLGSQPIRARHVTSVERLWRWSKRNRALALALVFSLFLLFGSLVGSLAFSWQMNSLARDRQNALLLVETEKRDANIRLVDANIARAQAIARSNRPGQRTEGLKAIREAVPLARSLRLSDEIINQLRDATISCISQTDIALSQSWKIESGTDYSVAFDPQLKYYAIQVRHGGPIEIRRSEDRSLVEELPDNPYELDHKWLSADAKYLAATRRFETAGFPLEIVDVLTGRVIHAPGHIRRRGAFQFSSNGDRAVISSTDGFVRVYRMGEPDPVFNVQAFSDCVAFAEPNQIVVGSTEVAEPFRWTELLAATRDAKEFREAIGRLWRYLSEPQTLSSIVVYSLDNGQRVQSFSLPGPATSIDVGPDGLLAVACSAPKPYSGLYSPRDPNIDGRLRRVVVFDRHSLKPILELENDIQGVQRVNIDKTGRVLIVASTAHIGLFDTRTGKKLLSSPGTFCDAYEDQMAIYQAHKLSIYRLLLSDVHRGLAAKYTPQKVALDPLSQVLTCADQDGLRIIDVASGKLLHHLSDNRYTAAAFTPDSKFLLTISQQPPQLKRWPISRDPTTIRIGPAETIKIAEGFLPHHLALEPTGELISLDDPEHDQIALFSLNGDSDATVIQGPNLMFVAISNDRRWAATGTWLGVESAVYDLRENKLAKRIFTGRSDVTFSNDSQSLICGCGKVVDLNTWQSQQINDERGTVSFVHGFATPIDQSFAFVTTGSPSSTLKIIDSKNWSALATLESGNQTLTSLRGVSREGHLVVVSDFDDNVFRLNLWDIAKLREDLKELDLDWNASEFAPLQSPLPKNPEIVILDSSR